MIYAYTVQPLSTTAVTWHTPSLVLQRYANHDLIKYLESIGAEFGACQNAYTSADDTVYEFTVPTDDADLQILDRSFDVFAEFATKIRQASSQFAQDAELAEHLAMGLPVEKLCYPCAIIAHLKVLLETSSEQGTAFTYACDIGIMVL